MPLSDSDPRAIARSSPSCAHRAHAVQPGPDNRGGRHPARHVARGKLLARDRIDALLDRGSPFLELAPLAACDLGDDWPAAGSSPASASCTGAT
jgi:acetyl-CoA carboxylase carboxyltransferase component